MTDAEIIKALECCSHEAYDCDVCPLNLKEEELCFIEVRKYALDLINRQKAEYEDLYKKYCELAKNTNERVPVLIKEVQKSKAELRAEAIKEFAERLKYRTCCIPQHHFTYAEVEQHIDYLVKEMAGDTE